jgi:hypothetical protein
VQVAALMKLNRKCGNEPVCSSGKTAETWCEFFKQSHVKQFGWLCDDCISAASCRANILRPKKSLSQEIESSLQRMFLNTGWQLVRDSQGCNVSIDYEDGSIEFQLQSELKV